MFFWLDHDFYLVILCCYLRQTIFAILHFHLSKSAERVKCKTIITSEALGDQQKKERPALPEPCYAAHVHSLVMTLGRAVSLRGPGVASGDLWGSTASGSAGTLPIGLVIHLAAMLVPNASSVTTPSLCQQLRLEPRWPLGESQ